MRPLLHQPHTLSYAGSARPPRARAQRHRSPIPYLAWLGAGLLAWVALALMVGSALAAAAGSYKVTGTDIRIYDLIGKVEILPGDGPAVRVEVTPGGRDAAQLNIRTGTGGGVSWLAVDFPGDRFVRRGRGWGGHTELSVRDDGRFGDRSGHWPNRGRRVRISNGGSGLEVWADLRIYLPKGQKAGVYVGLGDATVNDVDADLRVDCASASVTATRVRGLLAIDTGSGDVVIRDAGGRLSIDTGSGSVEATDVRVDRLAVDTGSGDVAIERARAREVEIDTGSGAVALAALAAPRVHVDTGSGRVHIGLLADIEDLVVDTGAGSVTVVAPADLGAAIRLETGSGDVRTDFPISVLKRDGDSLVGRIGDGRGQINIETGSGDVRFVRRAS
jgi:hypothetical protein